MKSPTPLIALFIALLLSGCGSNTSNTAGNTTTNTTSNTNSASSNTSATANTANTSNSSNTSTGESSGSHPTDQIDTAAKIESGKPITVKGDITLTLPADWKKDSMSNDNADWYTGKTKDGKELTLVVLYMPASEEYAGMSTPEAAMKYTKELRGYAEQTPEKYTLPRILKLVGDHVGVAQDTKAQTPDGLEEWSWKTFDSAGFQKGFTFRYPAGSFDQHKSLRDGIINSVKFKRGPKAPSL